MDFKYYQTDLHRIDQTGFVIPDGYTLAGVAFAWDYPNTCHKDKPILILTKSGKYYAQCACGENLTAGYDTGREAMTAFRAATRPTHHNRG